MKVNTKKESKGRNAVFPFFKSEDLPLVEVIPYKRITKSGYLVDTNDTYQAIIRVRTTDLVSMNATDLNQYISQLTTLCRIYLEPAKILSMTYLTETSKQQTFWKNKISQLRRALVSNELTDIQRKRIETKLQGASDQLKRMIWVEESLTELTFFIVVYGKNEKEINLHVRDMIRLGGKPFQMRHINKEKEIEKVLFRLNNMNTEI